MSIQGQARLAELSVKPINMNFCFKIKIYDGFKQVIASMNIYFNDVKSRLDERCLSKRFNISGIPACGNERLTRLKLAREHALNFAAHVKKICSLFELKK